MTAAGRRSNVKANALNMASALKLDDDLSKLLSRASRVETPPAKLAIQLHAVQLRLWVSDAEERAIRPWYIVILELYPRGKVVNQYLASPPGERPDARQLLRALLQHVISPPTGERRARPTHVSVVSERDGDLLRPHVEGRLRAELGVLTLADGVADYVRAFSDKLVEAGRATRADAADRPGILTSGKVTRTAASELAAAAVAMHGAAPWKRIADALALAIRVPSSGVVYYASVLGGSADSVRGVALMPTLSALRAKYRRANSLSAPAEKEKVSVDRDALLCGACGKRVAQPAALHTNSGDGAFVHRCGGCRRVLYCDKKCQRADWKRRHRVECARVGGDADAVLDQRDEWKWMSRELALLFVDPTAVPFDDLDAFDEHDWPFIDGQGEDPPYYPFAFVSVVGASLALAPRVERPNADEVEVLTAVARALVECAAPPPPDTTMHLAGGASIAVREDLRESCKS